MSFIFSNQDTVELAKRFGTPLYVFSADIFLDKVKLLKEAFEKTGIKYQIFFAGKSFLNLAMIKLLEKAEIGLDTVSGGELYTAQEAGFSPKKVLFHGNNKTEAELKQAIYYGVTIVVDSFIELDRISVITKKLNKKVNILVRVNPGVEAHTNELINTGKIDTKFGIAIDEVKAFVTQVAACSNINLIGLHCHIGSQITEEEPFLIAAKKMLNLLKELNQKELKVLDLGGGFGIKYNEKEKEFNPIKFIPKLINSLENYAKKLEIPFPEIYVEPGRFLSAEAGITLYEIGTIKEIPGIRTYISVNGGMVDNPRPALYEANYEAVICNKELTDKNKKKVRISGRACETDTLIKEAILADPEVGDILAILKTGAYNYSMASNYNRYPRPPVVLLIKDKAEVIVREQNYKDLLSYDLIPDILEEL